MTVSALAVVVPAVLAAVVGVLGFRVADRRAAADRQHRSKEAELDRRAQAEQARLDRAMMLERLTAEHRYQRELAAEARRQDRLADTYLLILQALGSWTAWMASIDHAGADVVPGLPEPHRDGRSLTALVAAFAPEAVAGQFAALQAQLTGIGTCAARIRELVADESLSPEAQERRHGTTFTREMRRLDRMRRDTETAVAAVRSVIRADLGTASSEEPTPSS